MSGRHPWPPPSKGQHASDCAVNNEPAFPAGSCDCGAHSDAATNRGYLFSVRVGGGPDIFTAWTTQDDGYEPFTQATGDSPEEALRALARRLLAIRAAELPEPKGGWPKPVRDV